MTSLSRFKAMHAMVEPDEVAVETLDSAVTHEVSDNHAVVENCYIQKFSSMTKDAIDNYASSEHDIYLDRRKTKENMIKEFIQKIEEKA